MDIRLVYSCLLGRPWIHTAGAVPYSLHQRVKFIADQRLINVMGEEELISTLTPIEYVEGNEEALETSFQSLEIVGIADIRQKGLKPSKATIMAAKVLIKAGYQPRKGLGKCLDGMVEPLTSSNPESQDRGENVEAQTLVEFKKVLECGDSKVQPLEESIEVVNIGSRKEVKEVKVGKRMSLDVRRRMVELLKEYVDVFAWSYQDMPDLDVKIVEHRLPILPGSVPWNARFLAVEEYPKWVANIVLVPKKDGKVHICVDYRDLNRASPKDKFPLSHIDMLVDIRPSMPSFPSWMAFRSKMAPEDRENTTFVTTWGTFYYQVMPFGLKNAGTTYQRAMVALFHDMMHKEIELYVDDMIAKSKTLEQHIEDLGKLFIRLQKFRLRLNPTKCTFGVKSRKLLGFIVNEKGIEVDPDKVKAILEMLAPRIEAEVKAFWAD
ncbi:hypothetical protein CR513_38273, partial [Mucuna pruriens]